MSSQSDIQYLITGLLLGGLIGPPIAFLLPQAELGVRLGVAAAVCTLGIGFGYLMAYKARHSRRKRVARVLEKQAATQPQAMPTQITGKACAACQSHIVFVTDGSFCKNCFQPFCHSCKNADTECVLCLEKQTVVSEQVGE